MSTKRCTWCRKFKPRSSFYRCSGNVDGLQSKCKDCDSRWRRLRNSAARPIASLDMRGERKVCAECAGLPWRVEGAQCSKCGLRAAHERTA